MTTAAGEHIRLCRDKFATIPTWRVIIVGPTIDYMGDIPITDDRYAGKVQQHGSGYVPLATPATVHRTRADAVRALLEVEK